MIRLTSRVSKQGGWLYQFLCPIMPRCYERYLHFLYYYFGFFGIFLPYDIRATSCKTQCFCKIYSVFWSSVIIISFINLEWLETTETYQNSRISNIILSIFVDVTITAISVIGILGNVFWNKSRWDQYQKLKKILENKMKMPKIKRSKFIVIMEMTLGMTNFLLMNFLGHYRFVLKLISYI